MSKIQFIGVVGVGQMGRGIAQVAAMSNFQTVMFDISDEGLAKGLEFIKKQLSRGFEKGKYDQAFVDQILANITTLTSFDGVKDCDLIVEAAIENKEIKFKIFKDFDEIAKKEVILVTNTSSISITEIAAVISRFSQVAGMYFMNPVLVMKLVEGIRGLETSDEVFKVVEETSQKMGKTFIKVNDVAGFAINRILMPMINEAVYAYYEGVASVEDIDMGMKLGCNQLMGLLELADFIGLDICLAIMEVFYEGFGDTKYCLCLFLKKYVLVGRMGRKSGRGFYEY